MGKSKKAPGYATASYDTDGLFGSSTASKKGVDFTANAPMTQAANTAWGGFNNSLSNINSNDYLNDPNFQVYQDNFNRQMQQAYDTNVLANLNDRGLMRSSGLQSATNSFNNTMNQGLASLMDSYYNRQQNNLTSNQNALSQLYNYITGINTGAQNQANNVSNYNLSNAQLQAQQQIANNQMYGQLAQAGAGLAAMALM